jgi:transposase
MTNTSSISSRKTSVGREERASANTASTVASAEADAQCEVIKIAIDMHQKLWVASRQLDSATPQPPQKFTPEQCMKFIEKQVKLAGRVVCCYEAGCFGFGPQRRIEALGARCLVIAPQDWDERHKNVRTDTSDTTAMIVRLDRYVAGNAKALAVVRVPSEQEEIHRSRVREREQFQCDRNRWANRGKSLLLQYGLASSWSWWKPDRWEKVCEMVKQQKPELAEQLLEILEDCHAMVLAASEKLDALTARQCKKQKEKQQQKQKENSQSVRLVGIGELSMSRIEAEIGDWNRFANRRQVASYTGLCPGVSGTGGKFVNLSVNKCGNRRLRTVLVELAWLLLRYQSEYQPLLQWKPVLEGTHRAARKKAIVALARRLAVDLWRIQTGQTTPEKLGLKVAA